MVSHENPILFFISILLICVAAAPVGAVTGADWSPGTLNADFSSRTGHTSVNFDNRLWVIGGTDGATIRNDIWSSSDGVTWTLVNASPGFPARNYAASVVFKNRMWIIGGSAISGGLNDVWSSADGEIWTEVNHSAEFPERSFHSAVVYHDRMWVIGGYTTTLANDTWSSADGEIWTEVNHSAEFPERDGHTSVVFDNRMWVIGGLGATECYNDTWSSTDGRVWTLANPSAAFPGRVGHATSVLNGTLWLAGGESITPTTWMNDTWSSTDGRVWVPANASADFPARNGHTMVIFKNCLWILGGADAAGYYNDTWYSYGPPVPAPPSEPANTGDSAPATILNSVRTVSETGNPVTFSFGQVLSPTNPVRVESVTIVPVKTFSGEILCIVKDPRQNHPLPAGQAIAGLAEIDLDWTREDSIRQGTIVFSLDRQWMDDHQVVPYDIVLLHNAGGTWLELPTVFDHQDAGRCYFTAGTPGFSVFAVGVKTTARITGAPEISPSPVRSIIPATSAAAQPHSTDTVPARGFPSPAPSITGIPAAPGSGAGSGFPLIPVMVLAGGIILLIAAFLLRRSWVRRQNPALFRKDR